MVTVVTGRVYEEDSGYVLVPVDQVADEAEDDEGPVAELVAGVLGSVTVDPAELLLLPDVGPVEEDPQLEDVDTDAVSVLVRVTGPVLLPLGTGTVW